MASVLLIGSETIRRLRVAVQPLLSKLGDTGYLHQVSHGIAIRLAILPFVRLVAAIDLDAVPGLGLSARCARGVLPHGRLDAPALDSVDRLLFLYLVIHGC